MSQVNDGGSGDGSSGSSQAAAAAAAAQQQQQQQQSSGQGQLGNGNNSVLINGQWVPANSPIAQQWAQQTGAQLPGQQAQQQAAAAAAKTQAAQASPVSTVSTNPAADVLRGSSAGMTVHGETPVPVQGDQLPERGHQHAPPPTGDETISAGVPGYNYKVIDASRNQNGEVDFVLYDFQNGQGIAGTVGHDKFLSDYETSVILAYLDAHPGKEPAQRTADTPGKATTIGTGFAGSMTDADKKLLDATNNPAATGGDWSGFVPIVGFSHGDTSGAAPVAIVNPQVHVAPATEGGFGETSTEENAREGRYQAMDIHGTTLDFGYYSTKTNTFYYYYIPSTNQGNTNPSNLAQLIGYTRPGSVFSNVEQGPESILTEEIKTWVTATPENTAAYNKAVGPENAIKTPAAQSPAAPWVSQTNAKGIPNALADTPAAQAGRAAAAANPSRPASGFLGMEQDLEAVTRMLNDQVATRVHDLAQQEFSGAPFPQGGKNFFVSAISGAASVPGAVTGFAAGFLGANRAVARTMNDNPAALPGLIYSGAGAVASGTVKAAQDDPVAFGTQLLILDLLGGGGLTRGAIRGTGGVARAVVEDWRDPEGLLHQSPGEVITRTIIKSRAESPGISVYDNLPDDGGHVITGPVKSPTGMNYQYPEETMYGPRSAATDDVYRPTEYNPIKGNYGRLYDELIVRRPVDVEQLRNYVPEGEQAEYAGRVNAMPKTGDDQFIEAGRGGAAEPLVSRDLDMSMSAGKGTSQEAFASKLDKWNNYYSGVSADLITEKVVGGLERITPYIESEGAAAQVGLVDLLSTSARVGLFGTMGSTRTRETTRASLVEPDTGELSKARASSGILGVLAEKNANRLGVGSGLDLGISAGQRAGTAAITGEDEDLQQGTLSMALLRTGLKTGGNTDQVQVTDTGARLSEDVVSDEVYRARPATIFAAGDFTPAKKKKGGHMLVNVWQHGSILSGKGHGPRIVGVKFK